VQEGLQAARGCCRYETKTRAAFVDVENRHVVFPKQQWGGQIMECDNPNAGGKHEYELKLGWSEAV
jgi:hypothetical protein